MYLTPIVINSSVPLADLYLSGYRIALAGMEGEVEGSDIEPGRAGRDGWILSAHTENRDEIAYDFLDMSVSD